MINQASVMRRVRDAVRTLDRAVVDLGPERARLCTYLSELRSTRDQKQLLLSPIAGAALPLHATGPVSIHCENGSGAFRLVCRSIERLSDTEAIVDLGAACLVESNEHLARYEVPSRRPLALVIPTGVQDTDGHVFPISEISSDSCVIDATVPIPPGQELGGVEVVGDRAVLRRAAATVVEVTPWCTADGSRRFRCTLRLRTETASAGDDASDVISDPVRVRRVMEFAALSGARGSFEAPVWGQGTVRFGDAERDALLIAFFPPPQARVDPRYIKLNFELFAVDYEVTVRVLERTAGWVRTAMPLHLRRARTFHRDRHVAREPGRGISLVFRNPVTGERETRDVSEISFQSITFDASSSRDLLWEGLPLEDACVCSGSSRIALGDTRIESVSSEGGRGHARAAITKPNIAQKADFVSLVSSLGHPDITVHDGQNFNAMLAIYKQGGLFAPHMRRNLDPIMPAAKRVWHRLHHAGPDLVQTFVHGAGDEPDGAVTAIRPWERAFVAQHFVSVNAHSATAAGRLQRAYVDHVQSRPEGHYLVFFVKSDNKQMNAFYERFFGTTGTPEAIERRNVQLWCKPGEVSRPIEVSPTSKLVVRALRATHEPTVSHAAERCIGVQGAAALSFLPGEFHIPETASGFARVGLKRKRVCETVSRAGQPIYAMIEEITSPGLNFTWMLNATWILPVHTEQDATGDALRTALVHILKKPSQTPTGDVFLNTTDGVDGSVLEAAGFEKLADLFLYTMNRAGLNRYFYYTSDRYGEVDIRTQQRELRRSSLAALRNDDAEKTRRVV